MLSFKVKAVLQLAEDAFFAFSKLSSVYSVEKMGLVGHGTSQLSLVFKQQIPIFFPLSCIIGGKFSLKVQAEFLYK